MKGNVKGSYTIELALLSPLLLGTMVFVLYTAFYFYNAGVIRIIAFSTMMEVEEFADDGVEQQRIINAVNQKELEEKLIGMEIDTIYVTMKKDEYIIKVQGEMRLPFFNGTFFKDVMKWNISVMEKNTRHREKKWIQDIRRIKKLGEKWIGEEE